MQFQYPLKWNGIKVPFSTKHHGIDFGWNLLMGGHHQKVYAVENGVVHRIDYQPTSGGIVIIIKHSGFFSEYGHLKEKSVQVKVGQKVKRGDYIAKMGSTGVVDGEHLHFGLYKGDTFSYNMNRWVNPLDNLYLYPGQHFMPGTIKNYGDKLKYYTEEPTKGVYKTLTELNIRKKPYGEKVKVKECTKEMQKALKSNDPNDYAVIKKGINFTALSITEEKDSCWAKNYNGYICISENGKKYCKKV